MIVFLALVAFLFLARVAVRCLLRVPRIREHATAFTDRDLPVVALTAAEYRDRYPAA